MLTFEEANLAKAPPELKRLTNPGERASAMRVWLQDARDGYGSATAHIARLDGKIVGWATHWRGLIGVYVHSHFRRRGIGLALATRVVRSATVDIHALPFDDRGFKFYEKVPTVHIKTTYMPGSDP